MYLLYLHTNYKLFYFSIEFLAGVATFDDQTINKHLANTSRCVDTTGAKFHIFAEGQTDSLPVGSRYVGRVKHSLQIHLSFHVRLPTMSQFAAVLCAILRQATTPGRTETCLARPVECKIHKMHTTVSGVHDISMSAAFFRCFSSGMPALRP